jgi:hypothetical protein
MLTSAGLPAVSPPVVLIFYALPAGPVAPPVFLAAVVEAPPFIFDFDNILNKIYNSH